LSMEILLGSLMVSTSLLSTYSMLFPFMIHKSCIAILDLNAYSWSISNALWLPCLRDLLAPGGGRSSDSRPKERLFNFTGLPLSMSEYFIKKLNHYIHRKNQLQDDDSRRLFAIKTPRTLFSAPRLRKLCCSGYRIQDSGSGIRIRIRTQDQESGHGLPSSGWRSALAPMICWSQGGIRVKRYPFTSSTFFRKGRTILDVRVNELLIYIYL
jgi:hypothetical protein